MFAKVFTQILDSSLANDYQVRHVFEDLLKLADINGVVDSTRESIARRTNVPLEIVTRAIAELEGPDPTSRTPDHEGRRLLRIDDHRDWGWLIVNYDYYREIASEHQRREKTRKRTQKYRKKLIGDAPVTPCDALKRSETTCDDFPSTSTSPCTSPSTVQGADMEIFLNLKNELSSLFKRKRPSLTYEEQSNLLEVSKRLEVMSELEELKAFRLRTEYFPRSLVALLRDWDKTLDQSRNQPEEIKPLTKLDKELERMKRDNRVQLQILPP